jgi:hypothetical protein
MVRPMLDLRRKRLIFLFLGNVASGVVTIVVVFFGAVLTADSGPLPPLLVIVGVPALATTIWRSDLQLRGREPDLAKRVTWQAFWVLIAWEAIAIVLTGTFIYIAYSAMAPVPHFHKSSTLIDLIVVCAVAVPLLWFTWVRSRRMLDLLWPLPGTPQPGSESPYQQMKL